jgi:mono/diheme cytochrome c family protein
MQFCACGCDLPGRPNPADRPVPADQVLSFSKLYGQNCAGCHGADGKLGPAPPLNDALFRSIIGESEVKDVVAQGRHKTLMPAFGIDSGGTLTEVQIQVLAYEIKGIPYKVIAGKDGSLASAEVVADPSSITLTWGPAAEPSVGTPPYQQPINSDVAGALGNPRRGAQVFSSACAVCHGSSGQGIVDGKETRRTLNDRVALQLISDQALRRYVITGRPDLGMPSFAGPRPGNSEFSPLTDRDVADLVALLASWRQETTKTNDVAKD